MTETDVHLIGGWASLCAAIIRQCYDDIEYGRKVLKKPLKNSLLQMKALNEMNDALWFTTSDFYKFCRDFVMETKHLYNV